MKRFGQLGFACWGVLLAVLAIAPGFLHGQSPLKPAPPTSPAVPTPPVQHQADLNHFMEQFGDDARSFGQELQAELADLSARVAQAAQEFEMSSPGFSKLREFSAQLDGKKQELIARAEELSARAEELTAEVSEEAQEKAGEFFTQTPGIFVGSTEYGGGWLGIEIGEVTPEQARDLKLSSARGVVVMDVEPESPAAKAGLKEKDVITQYEGQTVEGTVQFRRLVRETPPGRTLTLVISREGTNQNISVELGDRRTYFEKKMKGKMRDFGSMNFPPMPDFSTPGAPVMPDGHWHGTIDGRTPILGINAEDLTPQLGAFFGAPDDGGVLVREVRAGTPAEKAGLKAGDVITKVDGKPVHSLDDLRAELREKGVEKSVTLGILRKGSEMSVLVAIELPRPPEPSHRPIRAQS
jgi:C-terminal processing protease CtpA/Prc